jgi:hypothetical protein
VTPLANGFAATSDPARLQELCDLVRAGTVRVFFQTWMSRIPLPLTTADRDHGCWWQLAMRQVEVSRTLVFDDPRRVRAVFGELLAGNVNPGRPEHAEIIFGQKVTRRTPGAFSTRLPNRGDQVTINLSFRHSRIKIYLKEDHALRVETVINSPGDLGCKRSLEHLDELSAKARACNARLMDAVLAGQGSGILANPVIERIAHPTTDAAGRRVPAMRPGDPRVQALAGCLAVWDHVVGSTLTSLPAKHPTGQVVNHQGYRIQQTAEIIGGTRQFAAATGQFSATVSGPALLARNPDGSCAFDKPPLHETDMFTDTGTLSF